MFLPPRENPDLVGHENAEARFLAAWNSGRLPHAWLLGGPEGIGKATLAFRIARFVLSQGSHPGEDAGNNLFGEPVLPDSLYIEPDAAIFRRTASAGHADLTTLERTINKDNGRLRTAISVEDVRSCGDFLRLTPAEAGWRVLVVDSADELNLNAANALLKMLEEPPARALILLVCHTPMRLLPTIRSRCCQLSLKPLEAEQLDRVLSGALPDVDSADVAALSRLAEGSPGRAIAIAEQDGLGLFRELISLLSAYPQTSTAALHGLGDKLSRAGTEEKFRVTMRLFSWWLGRLVREASRGAPAPAPIVPEETGCGNRLIAAAGVERLLEVWEKVTALSEQALRQNLDRKHILLSMFSIINGAART